MNWPVGTRGSRSCLRALSVASVLLLAIMNLEIAADGPPPARLLPANDLVTYLEHDGLAAHSAAWKATAAYDILGRTSCGAMVGDVMRQVIDNLFKEAPQRKFKGSEILAIEQHLVEQGFALACYAEDGDRSTVYVVKAAGKPGDRTIELVQRYVFTPDAPAPLPAPTIMRGRRVFKFGDQHDPDRQRARIVPTSTVGFVMSSPERLVTTWFEGNDLIIVDGPNSGGSGSRLRWAKTPRSTSTQPGTRHASRRCSTRLMASARIATHPAFVAAAAQGRDLAGFEPGGLFLDEMSKAGSEVRHLLSQEDAKDEGTLEGLLLYTFGLHRAQRVVGRWGFRGKSLLTDIRFEASEPWNRVGAMLNPASLGRDRLPPIPGAGACAIGSFRATDLREALAPLGKGVKPESRLIFEAAEKAFADVTTRELRDQMGRVLGPTWCVYASPSVRPNNAGEADPAFLVEVRDSEATTKLLDELAARANTYFREQRPGAGPPVMAFGNACQHPIAVIGSPLRRRPFLGLPISSSPPFCSASPTSPRPRRPTSPEPPSPAKPPQPGASSSAASWSSLSTAFPSSSASC